MQPINDPDQLTRSMLVRMPNTKEAMRALSTGAIESLITGQDFGRALKEMNAADLNVDGDFSHGITHRLIEIRGEAVASVPLLIKKGTRADAEIIDGDELVRLIDHPNPDMSRSEYHQLAMQIMDMRGSVLEIGDWQTPTMLPGQIPSRFDLFDPREFEALPHATIGQQQLQTPVTAWRHTVTGRIFESHRVIVTRHPSRKHFPFGFSPYKLTTTYVSSDVLASVYVEQFIKNDCNASVWLLLEGAYTSEKLKEAQKAIDDRLNGVQNAGGAKIMANVKQILANPTTHREMQFQEGQETIVERLCAIWGVPKLLLGYSGDVNRATARESKAAFWEVTGLGLLSKREEAISTQFLRHVAKRHYRGAQMWAEFDRAAIPELQRNLSDKAANFAQLVAAGVPRTIAAQALDLSLDQFDGDGVGLVSGGSIPLAVATAKTADDSIADDDARALRDLLQQVIVEMRAHRQHPGHAITASASTVAVSDTSPPQSAPDVLSPRGRIRSAAQKARSARKARERWKAMREKILGPAEVKFAKRIKGMINRRKGEILRTLDNLAESRREDKSLTRAEVLLFPADVDIFVPDLDRWEEMARERLGSLYDLLGRDVAEQTARDTAPDYMVSEGIEGRWRDYADSRLGKELRNMEETQIQATREAFAKALDEQMTYDEVRKVLRDLPEFNESRANTVAVTEVNGMANNTRRDLWAETGLDDEIIWFDAGDENVRAAHVENANAGKRKMGEPFPSGARYPHDPLASPEDVIGCRCGFEPAL